MRNSSSSRADAIQAIVRVMVGRKWAKTMWIHVTFPNFTKLTYVNIH